MMTILANLKCNPRLIVALTFAFAMLLAAFLVGDHDNAGTLVLVMIGAYVIVAGQLPGKTTDAKSCMPCKAKSAA
ncbi:hypothetical protein [Alteromonas sp. AMM-1]|uniref:hypothetical protein n=1 Tax=Alteromonas sp. AMM-1 TaxID=3394233 RepID=UPI0039A77EDF